MLYLRVQILGFFFVCLWLVPFGFFISLSANDMVLPTLGGPEGAQNSGKEGVNGRDNAGEKGVGEEGLMVGGTLVRMIGHGGKVGEKG